MVELPIQDFQFLRQVREVDRLLGMVRPRRLPHTELIICCWCENQQALLARHTELKVGSLPRILTCPGGALALHPASPCDSGRSDYWMDQVETIIRNTHIGNVSLYSDLPCDCVQSSEQGRRLCSMQLLEMQLSAKTLIKNRVDVQVGCYCFVNWGSCRDRHRDDRTYFLTRQGWQEWKARRGLSEINLTEPFDLKTVIISDPSIAAFEQ